MAFALTAALLSTGCLETLEALGEVAEAMDEEEDGEPECDPAPASCRKSRPETATLHLRVSSPLPSSITIYSGVYEDGRSVWTVVPKGTSYSVKLPLGDYSAAAVYGRGAKTIIAVDGDYLDYSADDTCDGTCYEAVDGDVDLELED